jgi:hypothetical protein
MGSTQLTVTLRSIVKPDTHQSSAGISAIPAFAFLLFAATANAQVSGTANISDSTGAVIRRRSNG